MWVVGMDVVTREGENLLMYRLVLAVMMVVSITACNSREEPVQPARTFIASYNSNGFIFCPLVCRGKILVEKSTLFGVFGLNIV